MDNKSLNEKLLEFVGLEYKNQQLIHHLFACGYYLDGKLIRKTCPDLVNELGMQSKYLYPKLIELKCYVFKGLVKPINEDYYWVVTIHYNGTRIMEEHKSEALAFALACERLIYELEKENG
jgi:hypothetical protein